MDNLKAGSIFKNGDSLYTVVVDTKENYTFLVSNKGQYVIVWKINQDFSWCQGHYYTSFGDAYKAYKSLIK